MSGKPLGIGMTMTGFRVNPIDRVTDEVWDAVASAICANWTPERFLNEVKQAWAHELDEHKAIQLAQLNGKRF
jgi:hypothetical protein